MKYLDHTQLGFTTENCIFYKEKLWFSEYDCNELYCYDFEKKETSMVIKFENEAEYQTRLFSSLVTCENKIYCIPFSANKIYAINLENMKLTEHELSKEFPQKYVEYTEKAKFSCGHAYEHYIYLVSSTYPAIVELDTWTGELKYYDDWVDEIEKQYVTDEIAFFRKSIMVGETLFAPSCKGNCVLEFNAKTKQYILHEVGDETCAYSSICLARDEFWLSPRAEGPVVKWNSNTSQWISFKDYPISYSPCKGSFADIFYFNNNVYLIPLMTRVMLKVDEGKGELEKCVPYDMSFRSGGACIVEDKLLVFLSEKASIAVLDKLGNIKLYDFKMPDGLTEYHRKNLSRTYQVFRGDKTKLGNEVLLENYEEALLEYVEYIGANIDGKADAYRMYKQGETIYSKLVN